MSVSDLAQAVTQNGLATIIIAYFLFRDWKYNEQLLTLMSELKQILAHLNEREVNT